MVEISAIVSAVTSLKAAKDVAEAMIGLRDAAAFQSKLLEFQSNLIDANNAVFAAQDERSSLLERIRELEGDVARLKAWDAEQQRYELHEIAPGAVAYVPKESMRGAEPTHWLCANCYQSGKKRFLQAHRSDVLFVYHKCQECGGEIRVHKPPKPPLQVRGTQRYNPFEHR